jgi:hypothetical protein
MVRLGFAAPFLPWANLAKARNRLAAIRPGWPSLSLWASPRFSFLGFLKNKIFLEKVTSKKFQNNDVIANKSISPAIIKP